MRGQESPEAPRLFDYDASAPEATSNSFNSSSHNIFAGRTSVPGKLSIARLAMPTTSHPDSVKWQLSAKPIPLVAPVTNAVRVLFMLTFFSFGTKYPDSTDLSANKVMPL